MARPAIVDTRNLLEPAAGPGRGLRLPGKGPVLMRVLVAGGAGFIGLTLCARLLDRGDEVVCVDNLITGSADNLKALVAAAGSRSSRPTSAPRSRGRAARRRVNLACPASPADFGPLALEILEVGSRGVANLLDVARATAPGSFRRPRARCTATALVLLSRDLLGQRQPDRRPVGLRGQALEATWLHRRHGDPLLRGRIFNTYGPGCGPTTAG